MNLSENCPFPAFLYDNSLGRTKTGKYVTKGYPGLLRVNDKMNRSCYQCCSCNCGNSNGYRAELLNFLLAE